MAGLTRYDPVWMSTSSKQRKVGSSRGCILIVEDSEQHKAALRTCLGAEFYLVEAAHGSEGLSKAREHVPDLIVTEVMLPYMDGFGLCKAVKSDGALKHIPVILSSNLGALDYRVQGLEAGADAYLVKPYGCELIYAQIKSLLKNRYHVRAHYSRKVYIEPAEVPLIETENEFLLQAKAVVEAHLSDANFNLGVFSDLMYHCERQLQRKFKAMLGMTPMEYVRVMRLKRAVQLLDQHAGNISEIAFKVGFRNPRHFTSSFRRFFNVSPRQYLETTNNSGETT